LRKSDISRNAEAIPEMPGFSSIAQAFAENVIYLTGASLKFSLMFKGTVLLQPIFFGLSIFLDCQLYPNP